MLHKRPHVRRDGEDHKLVLASQLHLGHFFHYVNCSSSSPQDNHHGRFVALQLSALLSTLPTEVNLAIQLSQSDQSLPVCHIIHSFREALKKVTSAIIATCTLKPCRNQHSSHVSIFDSRRTACCDID